VTAAAWEAVLADAADDARLAASGFVVVPLLTAEEVTAIRTNQAAQQAADDSGLVIDFTVEDRRTMQATRDLLTPALTHHLEQLLVDRKPVMATFIVKHPGPESRMALHCEPSFTRGPQPAYNVWIPLVDVSAESGNGALHLLPGSQHLPLGWVGYNTPLLFRRYERQLAERTVALNVRAGDAVVYDSRMLHWSEANAGPASRPAIALAAVPRSAELVHVLATGRRHRQLYAVDEPFFVDNHPGDVPRVLAERYPLLSEFDDLRTLDPEAVASVLGTSAVERPDTVVPEHVDVEGSQATLEPRTVVGAQLPSADVDHPASTFVAAMASGGPQMAWEQPGARLLPIEDDTIPLSHRAGLRSLGGAGANRLLVVDPGTKVVIEGHDHPIAVVAYDCPEVNTGLWCEAGVATLVPGEAIDLAAGQRTTIWNDGPGSAWIVLAERLPRRRLVERFRRR